MKIPRGHKRVYRDRPRLSRAACRSLGQSAVYAAKDSARREKSVSDYLNAGVFLVIVVLGLALMPLSWNNRFRAVIVILVAGIALGFVYSTFALLFVQMPAAGYAVLLVAAAWILQTLGQGIRSLWTWRCWTWKIQRVQTPEPGADSLNVENPSSDNANHAEGGN